MTLQMAKAKLKLHVRAKRRTPEHDLQKAVAEYLDRVLLPPTFWTSIDHGAGKMTKAAAGIRKARGVKAGLPDVWIFEPMNDYTFVIVIELKSDSGVLSGSQAVVAGRLQQAGVVVGVARSIDDVRDILAANGIPTREVLS